MAGRALIVASALAAAPLFVAPARGAEAAQAGNTARNSLCAADETILFQCRTGRKLVSLCGRRTPAPGARLLYGNPGRLDYASSADAAFTWTGSGVGLEVHVRDGEREHTVYSRGRGTNFAADGRMDPYSVDGVLMDQGGAALVDRRCAGEASLHGRVQDFMPEGEPEDD